MKSPQVHNIFKKKITEKKNKIPSSRPHLDQLENICKSQSGSQRGR